MGRTPASIWWPRSATAAIARSSASATRRVRRSRSRRSTPSSPLRTAIRSRAGSWSIRATSGGATRSRRSRTSRRPATCCGSETWRAGPSTGRTWFGTNRKTWRCGESLSGCVRISKGRSTKCSPASGSMTAASWSWPAARERRSLRSGLPRRSRAAAVGCSISCRRSRCSSRRCGNGRSRRRCRTAMSGSARTRGPVGRTRTRRFTN